MKNEPTSIGMLENFLCAGTTALLLSFCRISDQGWFLALVALVPFLWRVSRVSPGSATALGALLAGCHLLVLSPALLASLQPETLLTGLTILITFSTYGYLANRIAAFSDRNAVFFAATWLPIEYIVRTTGLGLGADLLPDCETGLAYRVASLFGTLMVSFAVICVNLLILSLVERTVRISRALSPRRARGSRRYRTDRKLQVGSDRYGLIPDYRAPPPTGVIRFL